jgi:hypothetical protein
LEFALHSELTNDRRSAKLILVDIGERFDASDGVRCATLRAGRFWSLGLSPLSTVIPDTLFERLLPNRPKSIPAQLKPHLEKVA